MDSTQLIEKFNAKYHVQMFNIGEEKDQAKRLSSLDNYMFQKPKRNVNVSVYVKGLKNVMKQYITNNTKINANGNYDLSKFDLKGFVDEYEGIMSAFAKENGQNSRKPYENIKYTSLLNKVMEDVKPLNKSASNLWSQSILDRKISMSEMERITDAANISLREMNLNARSMNQLKELSSVKDLSGLNEEEQQKHIDAQKKYANVKKNLTNVILAKVAMTQVRAKRNWLWKLFNRKENNMEKAYLAKLVEQENFFSSKGYPVSEVLLANYKPVLKTPFEEAQKFIEADKNKVVDAATVQNVDDKPVKIQVNEANQSQVQEAVQKPIQPAPTKTIPGPSKK